MYAITSIVYTLLMLCIAFMPGANGYVVIPSTKSAYKANALTYSPFANSGGCKDTGSIISDMTRIKGYGVNMVRIYGLDCNALETTVPYAINAGLTVMMGIWTDAGNDGSADVATLISWMKANPKKASNIRYISIGNEQIYGNLRSASNLAGLINNLRSKVRAAGFKIPVATVDIVAAFVNNPALCNAVDFVGVNIHPYFNGAISASQSGDFVVQQIQQVSNVCGGKPVMVTETGYPHAGNVNGLQVPSKANQQAAIKSILDKTQGKVTAFTLYDDYWKSPGPFNVEQSWGLSDIL